MNTDELVERITNYHVCLITQDRGMNICIDTLVCSHVVYTEHQAGESECRLNCKTSGQFAPVACPHFAKIRLKRAIAKVLGSNADDLGRLLQRTVSKFQLSSWLDLAMLQKVRAELRADCVAEEIRSCSKTYDASMQGDSVNELAELLANILVQTPKEAAAAITEGLAKVAGWFQYLKVRASDMGIL